MKILPVLDLMKGIVVRGVAGRRESYRAVQSKLTETPEPLRVAEAFQQQLGLSEFYIADLDAITAGQPQLEILRQLARAFPGCWLDCGIRNPQDIPTELESEKLRFVAGLETIAGPGSLKALCARLGPQRVVFSLDLKAGRPLGNLAGWASSSAKDIAREAIAAGIQNLIVLDLAQVGVEAGVSTTPLCRDLKREFPEIQVVTGGGIRHSEDLIALEQAKLDGALVASAFHSGNITFGDLQAFRP